MTGPDEYVNRVDGPPAWDRHTNAYTNAHANAHTSARTEALMSAEEKESPGIFRFPPAIYLVALVIGVVIQFAIPLRLLPVGRYSLPSACPSL